MVVCHSFPKHSLFVSFFSRFSGVYQPLKPSLNVALPKGVVPKNEMPKYLHHHHAFITQNKRDKDGYAVMDFVTMRWKRMRSGDRPGLQNRRVAGTPVTGGFDPHSLPPIVFNNLHQVSLESVLYAAFESAFLLPRRRRSERTSTRGQRQGFRPAQGDMRP